MAIFRNQQATQKSRNLLTEPDKQKLITVNLFIFIFCENRK